MTQRLKQTSLQIYNMKYKFLQVFLFSFVLYIVRKLILDVIIAVEGLQNLGLHSEHFKVGRCEWSLPYRTYYDTERRLLLSHPNDRFSCFQGDSSLLKARTSFEGDIIINKNDKMHWKLSPRWRRGIAFASHAGDRSSIPSRDRPKSFKQVMITPLPNTRQQVWVSRILRDDHIKGWPVSQ